MNNGVHTDPGTEVRSILHGQHPRVRRAPTRECVRKIHKQFVILCQSGSDKEITSAVSGGESSTVKKSGEKHAQLKNALVYSHRT